MFPRDTQRKSAYESLRRELIHGRLPAGSRLTETECASRLGVHRSAIRETLALLSHEGLLERGRRGGYFVPILDHENLIEIYHARTAMEVGAVRLLEYAKYNEDDLKKLEGLCDAMQQACESGLDLATDEADKKFHEKLVELTGNRIMITIYTHSPFPLFSSDILTPEKRAAAVSQTVSEHREIVSLIRKRCFADAIKLLEKHLDVWRTPTTFF